MEHINEGIFDLSFMFRNFFDISLVLIWCMIYLYGIYEKECSLIEDILDFALTCFLCPVIIYTLANCILTVDSVIVQNLGPNDWIIITKISLKWNRNNFKMTWYILWFVYKILLYTLYRVIKKTLPTG